MRPGKLYWRIKKNGKWTWTPARINQDFVGPGFYCKVFFMEEE